MPSRISPQERGRGKMGKGDKRRPSAVSEAEYQKNWDATFGGELSPELRADCLGQMLYQAEQKLKYNRRRLAILRGDEAIDP